jgi:tetratricopeptide (TPR) repeat protein
VVLAIVPSPRLWALACALVCVHATAVAQRTENPFDRAQEHFFADVTRARPAHRAMLPLIELSSGSDRASPALTPRLFERIAADRRISPAVRAYARVLYANQVRHTGRFDEASRVFDELGYVESWRFVGPFDNEGKAGFDTAYAPERDEATNLDATFEGRERAVRWRTYPDVIRYGYVDFDAVMRPFENVCAYAETYVTRDRAEPLALWMGAGGASKVWWNGELVHSDSAYRGLDIDRAAAIVYARAGLNRVLVKTCVTEMRWGFYLRLSRANGEWIGPIDASSRETAVVAPVPAGERGNATAPVAPLEAFERAHRDDPSDARAELELAKFLRFTDADDPGNPRARPLAEHACEAEPSASGCLFASRLSEQRAERMRFVTLAEGAAGNDPEVLLARARLFATGPENERALPLLDRIPARSREGADAALLRADFYARGNLSRSARELRERTAAYSPESPWALRILRAERQRQGRTREAFELSERILALAADDATERRTFVEDALVRGDRDAVMRHLEALRAVNPGHVNTHHYAAGVYEGLAMRDEALDELRAAVELVPELSDAHIQLGRALLRFGQSEPAAQALRTALALSPQDVDTRRLLEHIRPARRPDEAFATSSDEILRRRRERSDYPSTILHDLRSVSVFQNGLGSTFRQIVVQIHNAEGARRWQTYGISFEPGTQWVDVRMARVVRRDGRVLESYRTGERSLSDERYRIYYNRSSLDVRFPDLEPGDTVELRYRVDDVAARNRFDDYFGDLQFLGSDEPIARLEYILITPASRQLYFNSPSIRGLRHEEEAASNGRRIHRYTLDDVPAYRGEPYSPGLTETLPYIHVSTYRTWEEVGRWWWGLVRDQLEPDDSLRRTVDELVRDAPDERTKVQRIYGWVLRNTRYIGLEFGIHGYKPYRVTEVVRRGFGDCKDKASLLYAMLTLAGIEARMVLVRTRGNGRIGESPASLTVFDHAIAYVPSLDLYLDGTAEHNGSTELPAGDQGVTVLVVGPTSVELRTTPVLPSSASSFERTLVAEIAADGGASLSEEQTVRGPNAASFRAEYESASMRSERLQRNLARTYPGLELAEQSAEGIDDFERPVTVRWRGRVPVFARREGQRLVLEPTTLDDLTPRFASRPTRRHPLDLGQRGGYIESRTVRVPSGMRAVVPAGGRAESPFGVVEIRYESSANAVTARTLFEFREDRVSADRYGEFREWLARSDRLIRERIVLEGVR